MLTLFSLTAAPICHCGDKACEVYYHFEFPVTLAPALDSFSVGDTIWVSLSYDSNKLTDLKNGNVIDVGNFDFNIDLNILRIDSLDGFALNYFKIIQNVGKLVRIDLVDAVTSRIQFERVNNMNNVSFAVVPLKKGVYVFGFDSFYESGDISEEINLVETNCTQFIEKVSFVTNNGGSNNYDLYVSRVVSEPPYNEFTEPAYNDDGGYTFIVQ